MPDFINGTDVRMPQRHGRLEHSLSPAELTVFRSSIGCMQWCSATARADVSAHCSLLQQSEKDLKVKDLAEAQRVIQYLKMIPEQGYMVRAVDMDQLLLCAYSDASWGNAPQNKTQAGYLIVITDQQALQRSRPAAVLEWKSHRIKRSVRSTLAAEANAMEASCDAAYYTGIFISECLAHGYRASKSPDHCLIAVKPVTDCRSLYDALCKQVFSTTERRVMVDLASIREIIGGGGESDGPHRWVPRALQWADGLTKRDPSSSGVVLIPDEARNLPSRSAAHQPAHSH